MACSCGSSQVSWLTEHHLGASGLDQPPHAERIGAVGEGVAGQQEAVTARSGLDGLQEGLELGAAAVDVANEIVRRGCVRTPCAGERCAMGRRRELELLGFPPQRDWLWTEPFTAAMTTRYPGFDPAPYHAARAH